MKHIFRFCILLFMANSLFGQLLDDYDPVFLLDVPFVYGEEDFVRRIHERTGNKREPLGLVLSGGSARAFAHIGVLRYLEEEGVVPDFIVTNSMGSIVGLLYSAGFSPDQIYRIISETEAGYLFRPGFPSNGGLSDVSNFNSLVNRYTGDLEIQNLKIPIMVLAEDIRTRRQVVLTQGSFQRILQAAFALPVFFPPVQYGDHLLVDGGITNLVPMVIAQKYSSNLIASTTFYNNPRLNLGNPLTVLSVSMDIFKARTGVAEVKLTAPMLIRSGVEHFSFMDFDRLDEISDIGYQSAKQQFQADLPWIQSAVADNTRIFAELEEIRKDHEVRMAQALNHIGKGKRIEKLEPMAHLFPRITTWGNPGDSVRLREGLFLGLDGEVGYKGFFANGYSGLHFTTHILNPSFSLGAQAGWFWGQTFSISGTGFVSLDQELRLGTVYANGLLEFYLPQLTSGGGGIWELDAPLSEGGDTNGFSLWLNTTQKVYPGLGLNFELGSTWIDWANPFGYGDLEIILDVPGPFRYRNRNLIKQGFGGSDVRIFLRDGLLITPEASNFLGTQTSRFSIAIESFRPTFAELLIVKDLNLGVYGEGAWNRGFQWGAGAEGSLTLSMIGLSRFTVEGYGGYDSGVDGFRWGISLRTE